MTGHSSRHFGETDTAKRLVAMKTFRDALIQAMRRAPIGGDVYNATQPALHAVDDLGLVASFAATR